MVIMNIPKISEVFMKDKLQADRLWAIRRFEDGESPEAICAALGRSSHAEGVRHLFMKLLITPDMTFTCLERDWHLRSQSLCLRLSLHISFHLG